MGLEGLHLDESLSDGGDAAHAQTVDLKRLGHHGPGELLVLDEEHPATTVVRHGTTVAYSDPLLHAGGVIAPPCQCE